MPRKKFHPEVIKKRYPESTCLFIKTIANRVYHYNKNALIITCGASGSGKSYVDLELMRGIYAFVHGVYPEDEDVVNRCFFKLNEFLGILNTEEIQNPKTSRGQMFISEEVGTQASNRTHQNIANRAYSFIVQTFRAKGMILFFNVPSFNFVDSQVRKQLHYLLETKMIDKNKNLCIVKPLELQYNSKLDQLYFHNLKSQVNRKRKTLQVIGFPKIPKSLEVLYEAKKSEFINNLNKDLQGALVKYELKNNPDPEVYDPSKLKPLTDKQKIYFDFKCEGLNNKQICAKLGVSDTTGSKRDREIQKKGYKYILPPKELEIPKKSEF